MRQTRLSSVGVSILCTLLLACGGGDNTGPAGGNGGDGGGDGGGGGGTDPAAIAAVSGDGQVRAAGTELAVPLIVRVTDAQGAGVAGVTVNWQVTAGAGSLSASSTPTGAQGQASVSLTLGAAAGPNTVTASVSGLTGSPVSFTAIARIPATLAAESGDGQNGKTLEPLPLPFVVRVTDGQGAVVPGVRVTWVVAAGDGTLSAGSSTSDDAGRASIVYTPGPDLGASTVEGRATGLQGSPVSFSAQTTVVLIRMQNTAFIDPSGRTNQQASVTVAVGDTIEWVNLDAVQHTATSSANPGGGSPFDSGLLSNGGRFRFVPDAIGTWTYFCQVHPVIMLNATINAQ